jgi:prenyltransferase beta subunit
MAALLVLTIFGASGAMTQATVVPAAAPALTTPRDTFPVVDSSELQAAIGYLREQQREDGGFAGFTPGQSDDFTTIKVALALNAARLPADVFVSAQGATLLGYLEDRAYSYTHDATGTPFAGRLGLLMLAVAASDASVTEFAAYPSGSANAGEPLDLPAILATTYQPATGAYSSTATLGFSSGVANALSQSFVLLGLRAAQTPAPAAAISFLRDLQEEDGGWGFGFGGDVDTTALVIQALIAQGVQPTDPQIQAALGFLRTQQLADGGWGFEGRPSADTTAFVIQALVAAGIRPPTVSWATANGGDPLTALKQLQGQDGSFGGNALGTAHAMAGLAQMQLPLFGRTQRAEHALAYLASQQGANGGWNAFGSPNVGGSLDVILAFAAAGYNPGSVRVGETSALDFLAAEALRYTRDDQERLFPAQLGKLIMAVSASELDPTALRVPGRDMPVNLVAELESTLTATGAYSTTAVLGFNNGTATPFSQSFALLGLATTDAEIPPEAITYLISLQAADGSWGGGVDGTGLALQALMAAGSLTPESQAVNRGVGYLRAQMDALGGWGNPNSTAFAMQGLLALDEMLQIDWKKNGRSPYEVLALYQRPDGAFTYTWDADPFFTPGARNDFATWQAIPALLGQTFPILPADTPRNFTPLPLGANLDQLVAAPAFGRWGNSITVFAPFGGDLNGDGTASLEWRPVGTETWTTVAMTRGAGAFSTVLAVSAVQPYELRVTFSDPDGVANASSIANEAVLLSTVEPNRLYVPMIAR